MTAIVQEDAIIMCTAPVSHCIHPALFVLKTKNGTELGRNCEHHVPTLTAKDYIIEKV